MPITIDKEDLEYILRIKLEDIFFTYAHMGKEYSASYAKMYVKDIVNIIINNSSTEKGAVTP